MHMSQYVRVDETQETKCCNIIKTTTHVVCNIQHQELPLLLDTQTSHVCNNENSTSATLKFNVCNTQQHASATSKLDVCNSETSKSTFATSRLIHMQHVFEIVTTSQHLDLLLQHSHETLANLLQKHPKHMQHTLATAPKLCLFATMTAARSSSSWPRGAAPRTAGELSHLVAGSEALATGELCARLPRAA
jgi:hypothetical protein